MPQQRYRTFMVRGRPGMAVDSTPKLDVTRVNDDPRTAQVATYTVTGDAIVTVEIDGVSISTAVAGGSTGATAILLAAAINAEPLVSGVVVATVSTDDVIVTARIGGLGFTATESDANLTLVQTTANADAAPVGFGVLVMEGGTDGAAAVASSVGAKGVNLLAALVDVAQMTAKVMTVAHTFVATTDYSTSITINGITLSATSSSPASLQALVEDLTPQLNAQLDAQFGAGASVVVTEDDTLMTFTAEIPGLDFDLEAGASDATATVVIATTTGGPQTDINRLAAGVTMEDLAQEQSQKSSLTDVQTMQYPANEAMRVRRMGRLHVSTEESIDPSTMAVFVGVDGGSQGLWRGTAAADFLQLDPAKFRWDENAGTDLAVLAVDLTA